MKAEQEQIKDFMVKAGQQTPDDPTLPPSRVRELRIKLIAEELCELCVAFGIVLQIDDKGITVYRGLGYQDDLVEAYDAVLDLLVVVIGTAVAMGAELDPGWQEVHRSNMSKFIDGHRREDGKWIKGPSYSPANLAPILEQLTKAKRGQT